MLKNTKVDGFKAIIETLHLGGFSKLSWEQISILCNKSTSMESF